MGRPEARLNRSPSPSPIINGLKREDLRGGIALWGYPGEQSCLSNRHVTPEKSLPIHSGSDASGKWHGVFAGDYLRDEGNLEVHREGTALTGTRTSQFGSNLPVTGSGAMATSN